MERPNTVSGLQAKRKELLKDLDAAEKAVKTIRINLDHVDATLRLFTGKAPYRVPGAQPVAHRAKKGELQRFVLACFREATGVLTSQSITQEWVKARELSTDHETYVLLRKRVGACLNTLKNRGTIKAVPIPGEFKGFVLNVSEDARPSRESPSENATLL